ncbi:hypothetical protein BC829DRAFT_421315 [Chytridium lagenaria]|nr:hypothetical protein BC829DRAFT_421315 [Chytridium lagenaria]
MDGQSAAVESAQECLHLHRALSKMVSGGGVAQPKSKGSNKLKLPDGGKHILEANGIYVPTNLGGVPAILDDVMDAFENCLLKCLSSIASSLRSGKQPLIFTEVRTKHPTSGAEDQAIWDYPRLDGQQTSDPLKCVTQRVNKEGLYRCALNGSWEIFMSERTQFILKAAKDDGIRGPIFANLKSIADGFWTPSVAKQLTHTELTVPVYEAKVLGNLRIVWQVDVVWLEARQANGQCIKVWSIGNHKDVITTLKRVVAAHKTYSKERQRRCKLRNQVNVVAGVNTPIMFVDDGGEAAHVTRLKDVQCTEVDPLLMHDMAVTAKFVPLSKMFFIGLCLHRMSPGIFLFLSAKLRTLLCIILTPFCFAEAPLYAAPSINANGAEGRDEPTMVKTGHHFNQIFITASPVFCAKVRTHFSRLLQTVSRGNFSSAGFELEQKTASFLKRISSIKVGQNDDGAGLSLPTGELDRDLKGEIDGDIGQELLEEEMEQHLLSSVPDSLMDLEPKHFPMFLTYRKFILTTKITVCNSINEVNRALFEKGYRAFPLVKICAEPGRGLMFAGDTAQTIARGSAFRFQDLSSMVYRNLQSHGGNDFADKHNPKQFQLTRNWSFDRLMMVFCVRSLSLGLDSQSRVSSTGLEFGAEQVILVRNENDAAMLRDKLNDAVIVLTIEQSKGMEFEDVLLYAPFGSSPAGNAWRVFLNEIPDRKGAPCPKFTEEKHNILSTELKILYTGITRARQRLWIFDPVVDAREALFSLWHSLSLVEQRSTPEKWMKQGKAFFERRQYEPALLCFRQEYRLQPSPDANKRCMITEANVERVKALQFMMEGKTTAANEKFLIAGNLYSEVGGDRTKTAAICYQRGGHHHRAGEEYEKCGHYLEAAQSFTIANNNCLAGKNFGRAGKRDTAIDCFKAGDHWDEAVEFLSTLPTAAESAGTEIEPIPYLKVVKVVKLASKHYGRTGDVAKRIKAIHCLDDVDEKAKILRTERMFKQLGEMLMSAKRFKQAALVWEHDLVQAASCHLNHIWDRVFQTKRVYDLGVTLPSSEKAAFRDTIQRMIRNLSSLGKNKTVNAEERRFARRLERQCRALSYCLLTWKNYRRRSMDNCSPSPRRIKTMEE